MMSLHLPGDDISFGGGARSSTNQSNFIPTDQQRQTYRYAPNYNNHLPNDYSATNSAQLYQTQQHHQHRMLPPMKETLNMMMNQQQQRHVTTSPFYPSPVSDSSSSVVVVANGTVIGGESTLISASTASVAATSFTTTTTTKTASSTVANSFSATRAQQAAHSASASPPINGGELNETKQTAGNNDNGYVAQYYYQPSQPTNTISSSAYYRNQPSFASSSCVASISPPDYYFNPNQHQHFVRSHLHSGGGSTVVQANSCNSMFDEAKSLQHSRSQLAQQQQSAASLPATPTFVYQQHPMANQSEQQYYSPEFATRFAHVNGGNASIQQPPRLLMATHQQQPSSPRYFYSANGMPMMYHTGQQQQPRPQQFVYPGPSAQQHQFHLPLEQQPLYSDGPDQQQQVKVSTKQKGGRPATSSKYKTKNSHQSGPSTSLKRQNSQDPSFHTYSLVDLQQQQQQLPLSSAATNEVSNLIMKITSSSTASCASKKSLSKKRRKRDPDEPNKPVSAYALFFRDTQAAIKNQKPDATFGDVSKMVAHLWDNLEPDKKLHYKRRTDDAKKEYLQNLAIYRARKLSLEPAIGQEPTEETAPLLVATSIEPNVIVRRNGSGGHINFINSAVPPNENMRYVSSSFAAASGQQPTANNREQAWANNHQQQLPGTLLATESIHHGYSGPNGGSEHAGFSSSVNQTQLPSLQNSFKNGYFHYQYQQQQQLNSEYPPGLSDAATAQKFPPASNAGYFSHQIASTAPGGSPRPAAHFSAQQYFLQARPNFVPNTSAGNVNGSVQQQDDDERAEEIAANGIFMDNIGGMGEDDDGGEEDRNETGGGGLYDNE